MSTSILTLHSEYFVKERFIIKVYLSPTGFDSLVIEIAQDGTLQKSVTSFNTNRIVNADDILSELAIQFPA